MLMVLAKMKSEIEKPMIRIINNKAEDNDLVIKLIDERIEIIKEIASRYVMNTINTYPAAD